MSHYTRQITPDPSAKIHTLSSQPTIIGAIIAFSLARPPFVLEKLRSIWVSLHYPI
ncbi:hypothetical protein ACKFKF_03505 [Phormidesmis sp. 146-12]